ncbi:sensor domain-containing protein [Armatimonas rosea]|uniref:Diguanylate cyclase (GGDEF)-like protein n=1 Tax=Armatimonas rosea TaxID=685828 RepID=A0A7W9SPR7_ARMRO|nr:EAL domain-containing protein [Armatimonas rosea]MBB6050592.1 diguanylate cyclase (GGDEF)-like protein [Armatimonas rosea]
MALLSSPTVPLTQDAPLQDLLERARCLFWQSLVVECPLEQLYPDARVFHPERGTGLHWRGDFLNAEGLPSWLPLARNDSETLANAFQRALLREDSQRRDATAHQALHAQQSHYDTEFRVRLATGELRWLHEEVHIQPLAAGHWRLTGICTDITSLRSTSTQLVRLIQEGGVLLWEGHAYRQPDSSLVWHKAFQEETVSRQQFPLPGEPTTYARDFFLARSEDDQQRCTANMQAALEQGLKHFSQQFQVTLRDGTVSWFTENVHIEPQRDGVWQLSGVCHEITALKSYEANIRQLVGSIRCLLGSVIIERKPIPHDDPFQQKLAAYQGMTETGEFYEFINYTVLEEEAVRRWIPIAWASPSLTGRQLFLARLPEDQMRTINDMVRTIQNGEKRCLSEYRIRLASGELRWMRDQMELTVESANRWRMSGFTIDITQEKQDQERLHYQAHHDMLTGLPNRLAFQETLEQWRQSEQGASLMILDLDNFKHINDNVGHPVGDAVLIEVARRLERCVHDGLVARLGGDEFTIVLPGMPPFEALQAQADQIAEALAAPLAVGQNTFAITASIGIVRGSGLTHTEYLRNADLALYEAKEQGRARSAFYTQTLQQSAHERFELESALRLALETDQLTLWYQPLIDLETGTLLSLEGLARWTHPTLGSISPTRFIPIAEQSGLIAPLGRKLFTVACAQLARWQRTLPGLRLSVNLSGVELKSQSLTEDLAATLKRFGIAAEDITLEITESVTMTSSGGQLPLLDRLSTQGFRLAIDDFGTGYSSMAYLTQLPVQELKVDRSFVRHLDRLAHDNQEIIRAVVGLARALQLEVIAEGIETEAQQRIVHALGVQIGQGYLFARPCPAQEIEARFLRTSPPVLARAA